MEGGRRGRERQREGGRESACVGGGEHVVIGGGVRMHMLCVDGSVCTCCVEWGVGGGVDLLHIIMSLFLDMQLSRLPMQVPISGRRD